eukprot:TRINITY_DN5177_c0_g1_i1.p1 TRINITY_DN5177_c0_g1~~TRINITY_DN5177_c0_g1_i1.p1  ORF type:complete len:624 (+),score=200.52 TRINITY_DN5177_c0_g1_i1:77-1873(+)
MRAAAARALRQWCGHSRAVMRGVQPAAQWQSAQRRQYCSGEDAVERDEMEYDVVIVGAGPSGLAAAIKLKQLATEGGKEVSVCVVEKGSMVGAHILSGACIEPTALNELLPDWQEQGAPLTTPVQEDAFVYLSESGATRFPNFLIPPSLNNHGNYLGSLGSLCAWMGEKAEEMGVEIFPGFAAADAIFEDGKVVGIVTDDKGIGKDGAKKAEYQPGMLLKAKQTIFAEGCRGSVTKKLWDKFDLRSECDIPTYALGIKEVWEIDPAKHKEGFVMHTVGYPILKSQGHDASTYGGSWMYHMSGNQVSVGFVTALDYKNSYTRPYMEMQKWKTHPEVRQYLEGGKCIMYGARTLTEGGLLSLPKLTFPGGVLVGDTAGTLNLPKIKGTHTAMKSGMLAAEAVYGDVFAGDSEPEYGTQVTRYEELFKSSWLHKELYRVRNVRQVFERNFKLGCIYTGATEMVTGGIEPFNLKHLHADHESQKPIADCKEIQYPKPDGVLTFDLLTNHSRSQTSHEGDQPAHLKPNVWDKMKEVDLGVHGGVLARVCPAGVYEYPEKDGGERDLVINAQNCLHCKACDIKNSNMTWTCPEGGGGPNYDASM